MASKHGVKSLRLRRPQQQHNKNENCRRHSVFFFPSRFLTFFRLRSSRASLGGGAPRVHDVALALARSSSPPPPFTASSSAGSSPGGDGFPVSASLSSFLSAVSADFVSPPPSGVAAAAVAEAAVNKPTTQGRRKELEVPTSRCYQRRRSHRGYRRFAFCGERRSTPNPVVGIPSSKRSKTTQRIAQILSVREQSRRRRLHQPAAVPEPLPRNRSRLGFTNKRPGGGGGKKRVVARRHSKTRHSPAFFYPVKRCQVAQKHGL